MAFYSASQNAEKPMQNNRRKCIEQSPEGKKQTESNNHILPGTILKVTAP